MNVSNEEEFTEKIGYIQENLNENDYFLIWRYAEGFEELSITDRFFNMLNHQMFGVGTYPIYKEIRNMSLSNMNYTDNKVLFDIFKFYFPLYRYDSYFRGCYRLKPYIFYAIRRQLIFSPNEGEIAKRLKYDYQIRQCVIESLHYLEESRIPNKHTLNKQVDEVCAELLDLMSMNDKGRRQSFIDGFRSDKGTFRDYGIITKEV